MQSLTREVIEQVLGPVDETRAAEIAGVGASADELAEARGWVENDEAMRAAGRPPPTARVAALIELLEVGTDEDQAGP